MDETKMAEVILNTSPECTSDPLHIGSDLGSACLGKMMVKAREGL